MANNRQVTITTPLGDKLELASMRGQEELGHLFCYEVMLLSSDESIDPEDILGHSVTINLELADGSYRYFNGIVGRFSQQGIDERDQARYSAVIHPWLWLLKHSSNCRMFQEMTVVDIIKVIFGDNGFSDYEFELSGNYQTFEYCAQYRETDFNFVSRLMEQEGIYYFFIHEENKHKLVLADSYSAHQPIAGEPTVAYHGAGLGLRKDECTVANLDASCELQAGAYAQTDYDFKKPKSSLLVKRNIINKHPEAEREMFDFPGGFADSEAGEQYALRRIEEKQAGFQRISADTDVRTMSVGGLFTLSEHPRDDRNAEFLVTRCSYELNANISTGGSLEPYVCHFSIIDASKSFRTPRATTKPFVQGPQTAVVVIDTADEYGRIKVRFFWDRENADSCWVRVSQGSAGSGWGAMSVPHVDHEVIVSFLEGDPDRPIITGRVYNADNMPPGEWSGDIKNSVITDHGGNHIVLTGESGSEGIEIRDKHGNEIVLDAVEGTIKIHSPTHESGMIFGRSTEQYSLSDGKYDYKGSEYKVIAGVMNVKVGHDVLNFFGGIDDKTNLGWKQRFVGGFKTEQIIGGQTKNIRGAKLEIIRGSVFKKHQGRSYKLDDVEFKGRMPKLVQMCKIASEDYEDVKKIIKNKEIIKNEGKSLHYADELHNEAFMMRIKADNSEEIIKGDKKLIGAENWVIQVEKKIEKAETIVQEASKQKFKGEISLG